MYRISGITLALALMVGSATRLDAEPTVFYFGVDVVSNYVSNGVTQSDGKPAIQPFFELENSGFYAGTWMSTVDFGDQDDWEIDLYLGYRRTFASDLFLDFGYARYLYDDSGDCCGEFKITAAYPILPSFGVRGYVAYNPDGDKFNRSLTLAYEVTDALGVAGTYGRADSYDHEYWFVGASYAFDDFWSVGLGYQGSETEDEGFVFRVSLANSNSNLLRLLVGPFER